MAVGISEKEAVFCPLSHTYDVPPPPLIVVLKPTHTAAGDAVAVIFGSALKVSVTVVVPEQPLAVVPVTE